jgi:hypothetical protein
MVQLRSRCSLLIFCLDDLSVGDKGGIKVSHYHCVGVSYVFRSFRVCLMNVGSLMLSAYRLIIIISISCISTFISMECPSLSHLINVGLNSTLREVLLLLSLSGSIALVNILPAFHLKPVLVSVDEMCLL